MLNQNIIEAARICHLKVFSHQYPDGTIRYRFCKYSDNINSFYACQSPTLFGQDQAYAYVLGVRDGVNKYSK